LIQYRVLDEKYERFDSFVAIVQELHSLQLWFFLNRFWQTQCTLLFLLLSHRNSQKTVKKFTNI
jgi:hypothetical protein